MLIGNVVGEMIGFIDREHTFVFVTPYENIRTVFGYDKSLLKVLLERVRISLLLGWIPLVVGKPIAKVLLNVMVRKGVEFFMIGKLKSIMTVMEIVCGLQVWEMVPGIRAEVGKGSIMNLPEAMPLD